MILMNDKDILSNHLHSKKHFAFIFHHHNILCLVRISEALNEPKKGDKKNCELAFIASHFFSNIYQIIKMREKRKFLDEI